MTTAAPAQPISTWRPLRVAVFRAIWLAQLGSNVGTWMQTVGAQWLLVHEPHASTLVALVQTASSLPFLLVGLPAGVLADVFDRRRYLMAVQGMLVATAGAMAALTFAGLMTPALLLGLTFVLGVGAALSLPAWMAITPSLVSREELPAASALGGINQNLARAAGPALAGVLIAQVGAGAVFAVNAVSFLGGIVVMALWRPRRPPEGTVGRERMVAALRAGTRYVWNAPIVRRILWRVLLFVAPGAALWALLPLVASRRLGLGASGYGALLGALGAGAIAAAVVLPRLRQRLSSAMLVGGSGVLYAGALAVCGVVSNVAAVVVALLAAGFAWLAVLVTLSASMQLILPGWVRARGLSVNQIVFMGGQAIPAVGWGVLAQHAGLRAALLTAAVLLAASSATVLVWPLHEVAGIDRTPVTYWNEPVLALDPEPTEGPVLVTLSYTVPPENAAAFVEAMEFVERSRRRTGAISWDLYRDGELPERFLELYLVSTWEEHLRQHEGRLTGADREFERRARALTEGDPEVAHLFPADTPLAAPSAEEP